MRVPLLDVRRQNLPLEAELSAAFDRVLRSGQFILGPEVEQFETAAATVAGARFGIGVSSGTDAILVALMFLFGIAPQLLVGLFNPLVTAWAGGLPTP